MPVALETYPIEVGFVVWWIFSEYFFIRACQKKTKRLVVGCGFCKFGDPLNL